jgi:nitroimidazol reductase NimA-like FMN-containing flavoprotein (pyridoxamine 5'-phosphate oxidase superfamily)
MTTDNTRDPELIAALEPIPPATCWNLLATATVGRVGLIVDGKPEVLPVNYAIDGESILFRTGESTVLTQASLSVVAFEVDHLDPSDESGWSVMVQGLARDIGDAIDATSDRQRHLSLVTWAPGTRSRWFHIKPDKVTGRRVAVYPSSL